MISKDDLSKKAEKAAQSHKQLFQKLRKKPLLPQLDSMFQELHQEAFSKINCLECANCCRSLGPRLSDRDIERLAQAQKMRPSQFSEQYLNIDEDGDYVFKSMPCPFLAADNYCTMYNHRPKACREYPHTNSRKMINLLHLTLKNTSTCPAVYEIVEGLKNKL